MIHRKRNGSIYRAFEIAKKSMRSCYGDRGILAGRRHFNDYWARDGFLASLGSLKLGDMETVRQHIKLFCNTQAQNGQIAVRYGSKDNTFIKKLKNILHVPMSSVNVPSYLVDRLFKWESNTPCDSNSLFIICCAEYLKQSGDKKFIKSVERYIDRAASWLQSQMKNGLYEEKPYAGFYDSVKKEGHSLYANVLLYKAFASLKYIQTSLSHQKKSKTFHMFANKLRKNISETFYTGTHFLDWIKDKKTYSHFTTDGNLFAIWFGLATPTQTSSILDVVKNTRLAHPVPCRTNTPSYPKHLMYPPLFLIGMGDYHNNSLGWLWLGSLYALCLYKHGLKRLAQNILKKIADLIVKHDQIYEVYDKSANPVKRFFYTAESPFALSAAFFALAVRTIFPQGEK
ncbi:MAG TPA: hypothetical protein VJ246_02000 [Patescibacteria group bacterium]|nr:hypothetical protein [Patescibacteria group bacterium]